METRKQRRARERREAQLASQVAEASTLESKERFNEILGIVRLACGFASFGWSVIAPNSSPIFGSILLFISVVAMLFAIRKIRSFGRLALVCVSIVAVLVFIPFDWYVVIKPQRGKPFQDLLVHGYRLTTSPGHMDTVECGNAVDTAFGD